MITDQSLGMILLNGVQQNMAYIAIKRGPDAARDEDPMRWFHTLQIGYQTSVLHCYNNVHKYAKEQAKKGGGYHLSVIYTLLIISRMTILRIFAGDQRKVEEKLSLAELGSWNEN